MGDTFHKCAIEVCQRVYCVSWTYWLFLCIGYDVVKRLWCFFIDILNNHQVFHLYDKNVLLCLVLDMFLFVILCLGSECLCRFPSWLGGNLFTIYWNECYRHAQVGVRRVIAYRTRFQAHRGRPLPFQSQNTLSRKYLNLSKRSFRNVVIDAWNS